MCCCCKWSVTPRARGCTTECASSMAGGARTPTCPQGGPEQSDCADGVAIGHMPPAAQVPPQWPCPLMSRAHAPRTRRLEPQNPPKKPLAACGAGCPPASSWSLGTGRRPNPANAPAPTHHSALMAHTHGTENQESGEKKLLRSCRAAPDVFRSVGNSAMCGTGQCRCNAVLRILTSP